jgi:hypothetical protein
MCSTASSSRASSLTASLTASSLNTSPQPPKPPRSTHSQPELSSAHKAREEGFYWSEDGTIDYGAIDERSGSSRDSGAAAPFDSDGGGGIAESGEVGLGRGLAEVTKVRPGDALRDGSSPSVGLGGGSFEARRSRRCAGDDGAVGSTLMASPTDSVTDSLRPGHKVSESLSSSHPTLQRSSFKVARFESGVCGGGLDTKSHTS